MVMGAWGVNLAKWLQVAILRHIYDMATFQFSNSYMVNLRFLQGVS